MSIHSLEATKHINREERERERERGARSLIVQPDFIEWFVDFHALEAASAK